MLSSVFEGEDFKATEPILVDTQGTFKHNAISEVKVVELFSYLGILATMKNGIIKLVVGIAKAKSSLRNKIMAD